MITLLIILLVCHFVGDFTHCSRPWMLAAKKMGRPVGPIAAHALVHAVLMCAACLALVGIEAAIMALIIQFLTHLVIDVAKGRTSAALPVLADPTSYWFWWLFGFDQLLHSLVVVLIAWAAINIPI